MLHRSLKTLLLCLTLAGLVFGQGLNTTASKDDWEEINFEFDSSILTDGYPSLLRLAELLNQNPGFNVALVGHADSIGSESYNDELALKRANAVKEFLEQNGARSGQITASGRGESDPKVNQQTDEARFMNRRVQMTVTDAEGRIISAGGIGDAHTILTTAPLSLWPCIDHRHPSPPALCRIIIFQMGTEAIGPPIAGIEPVHLRSSRIGMPRIGVDLLDVDHTTEIDQQPASLGARIKEEIR